MTKKNLLGSVGYMSDNRPDDVKLITELLNGVPVSLGGPAENLQPTSSRDASLGCNVEVMNAITEFQRKHFRWGRACLQPDSATLYKLYQLSDAGDRQRANVDVIPGGKRARIIDEARKWVGKVGDKGESKKRRGADILKRIFDEAMEGAIGWDGPQKKYIDGNGGEHMVSPREGIEIPGMRIPQDGKGLGMNWCGIYANWVWRNAGTDIKWKPGDGGGPKLGGGSVLPVSKNYKALTPGDICFIPKANHHFILVSVSQDGKALSTIDGNAMWQEIVERKIGDTDGHKTSELRGFYSFDSVRSGPSIVSYP